MSDIEIRRAAIAWLGEQVDVRGQVLSRETLGNGFPFKGEPIPLVSPQGIMRTSAQLWRLMDSNRDLARKTTLKAEIGHDVWATLNSDTSRPFRRRGLANS